MIPNIHREDPMQRSPNRRVQKTAHERQRRASDPDLREHERTVKKNYRDVHPRPFVGIDGEGGQTGPCQYETHAEFQHIAENFLSTLPACKCRAFQRKSPRKIGKRKDKNLCVCGHRALHHVHEYHLLRARDRALETGRGLTSRTIFPFLADLDPSCLYVAYFMEYDIAHWVNGLPIVKLERLVDRHIRKHPNPRRPYRPVTVAFGACLKACECVGYTQDLNRSKPDSCVCEHESGDHDECFEIDWLPRKFFMIRRYRPYPLPKAHWVVISETGAFFQQSFVKTIREWEIGTPEQRDQIIEGKEERENYLFPDDAMRAYNALEVEMLADLMTKFRAQMRECGLPMPDHWQGPGDLAAALLKQHRIPKAKTLPFWQDNAFKEAMNWTYYGGWFETSAVGYVPDLLYDMDINSAYPYALTKVPCLVHGTWTEGPEPTSELFIAFGRFEAIEDATYYGLPFRTKEGAILRPKKGNGWYWSFEIEASKHQRFDYRPCRRGGRYIGTVYSYHQHCDCQPFKWVRALYEQRLQLGKSVKGKVLKLVLNSLYGKLCQRVGAHPYTNLVWPSFVTAKCRTQVQDFLHSLPDCQQGGRRCGNSVPYIATDGILTSELPLGWEHPKGKPLGAWDHDPIKGVHRTGAFIMQPGLYFGSAVDDQGERVTPKTRGIRRNLAWDYEPIIREKFRKWLETGKDEDMLVPVTMRHMYSLRYVRHLNKFRLLGQWDEMRRNLSFDWTAKRGSDVYPPVPTINALREYGRLDDIEYLRTYAPNGKITTVSRAYSEELASFYDEKWLVETMDGEVQPDDLPYLGNPQEDI